VAWIRAVPVDRQAAVSALRRSLEVGWTGDRLLVAGIPERPSSVSEYLHKVAQLLDLEIDEEGL
jgi:hypothetical protein